MHNAQLQRLVLYFLIWGEAANLRHTPECLCFIFYTMAHSLMLLDTREEHEINGIGIDFQEVRNPRACLQGFGFGPASFVAAAIHRHSEPCR